MVPPSPEISATPMVLKLSMPASFLCPKRYVAPSRSQEK